MEVIAFAGRLEGAVETTPEGTAVTTINFGDTLPKAAGTGIEVTEFTCTAKDYKYTTAAGVTFAEVGTVVINDQQVPKGNAVVIGGHMVNKLAVGTTEAQLTAAGQTYSAFSADGKTLYAAGYTADDTAKVVNELITAVKALA